MYPSTQDLLKIRDGEPVDARVRAAVDADPELAADVERLRRMQNALQALPAFEPPEGVWEQVALATRTPSVSRWHWPMRAAIAASFAVAAILWVMGSPETPPGPPVAEAPVPSSVDALTRRFVSPAYVSLVQESARLERELNRIDYRPRLVNAATAATIAGLTDEIALIDARFMQPTALQPSQAEALQRTRVELMNALLEVRYAQAQRSGF